MKRRLCFPDLAAWGVTVAGALLLFLLRPGGEGTPLPLVAVLTALGAGAEGVPFASLYRVLYPSFSAAFAAFLLGGPGTAAWVIWVSVLVGRLLRRRTLREGLFAAAVGVAGLAASVGVYRLAGGGDAPLGSWFALSLVSPVFFVMTVALLGLQEPRAWQAPARLATAAAAHVVSTAFGLLLAVSHLIQGSFAFFLVAVALGAVVHLLYLHDELQAANLELRTLHETAGRLNAALRLDGVFSVVAEALDRTLAPQNLALFLCREGGEEVEDAEVRVRGAPLSPPQLAFWRRLAGAAAARREGVLIQDGAALASAGEGAPRSFLAVPLVADGQLLGVIAAGHAEPRRFGRKHLRLLTILSGQVAAVLRSALLYEKVENLAVTDDLTGLYNYRYLHLRLAEELRQARAHGTRLAVLYLDLDRFKACNDAYGHLCGDHILREFAGVLRRSVRQTDVAARYGGDEFVVILPGAGRGEALETLRRIKEAVRSHAFAVPGRNVVVCLGVSAGVACYPEDGETPDELLSAADRSMYREKDGQACAEAE